jgi:hypothetical protein
MTRKQMALAKKVFAIGAIFMMLFATVVGAVLSLISY